MGKSYRSERLGEEIRKLISDLLLRTLKDPRLEGIVSISAVEVTADYSYATVYISVLDDDSHNDAGEEERKEEVLEAFRSAKGLIRKEIGKQIKLRHAPDLLFKIDSSLEYGQHISQIIAELDMNRKKDKENEEL
ncbi:MAG: 30S ribosome-binding factor RbfA [Eubacteriales bacterium]|nr:30S ribosome-binding factor RbfA [Eubacteriales bacterium]MDD4582685.1 30S ribosome-binding factor RbfA [Eubacteriales bacterium]